MVNSVPGLVAGLLAVAIGGAGTFWSDSAETREIITANCKSWSNYSQNGNSIMANYYSDLVTYVSGVRNPRIECARRGVSILDPSGAPDLQSLVATASD